MKKQKQQRNLFGRIFDPRMWFFDFVKWTGALPIELAFRTKKIYMSGKRPKKLFRGKFIVASNHISFLDPIIVGTAVPFRRVTFVATKDLFQTSWGNFFRAIGIIEIDKENPSMETFKKVKKMLYNGHIVCVFPEGTISRDEETKAFKTGIVMMAVMSQADIVPMYIGQRETFKQRKVTIIGDRLRFKDLFDTPFPSMNDIRRVGLILEEKEKELENKFKELYKKDEDDDNQPVSESVSE